MNELTRSYMKIILLITCLGSMMAPLDSTIVSVSLPVMTGDLRMSSETAIWIPTAYLVSLAVLLLTIGRLSDIRGRKNIFILGFGVFVLGSLLCSLAPDGDQLIVFRVLQGIGAACIAATSTAIITDTFPSKERGKALGMNAMAVYIGLSLGPALGGLLTGIAGWRSIFWINIPIGIAVMVLAWRFVRDTGEIRKEERLDVPGVLLFSVGLTSLLIFLTLGEQYGRGSAGILGLIVLATISLLLFFIVEHRKGQGRHARHLPDNRQQAVRRRQLLRAAQLCGVLQRRIHALLLHAGGPGLLDPLHRPGPAHHARGDGGAVPHLRLGLGPYRSRSLASIGMATVALGLLFMSA